MTEHMESIRRNWRSLVALLGGLLVAVVLIGSCQTRPEPNAELVRTTRTAVEMADRAQRSNDASYLWPGRFRLLALAIGITPPLAAAVVVLVVIVGRRQGSDRGTD